MTRAVAFLTDFGTTDPFVGVMKGVVLSWCPEATLLDLTHGIRPQAVMEGAFWLEQAMPFLPERAVVVAVVDPGVGTSRRGAVVRAGRRLLVGPDNGLLTPAAARAPGSQAFEIDVRGLGLPEPSRTFHGRDVFARVAGELAAGRLSPEDVGPRIEALEPSPIPAVRRDAGRLDGVVVTVDRFGNAITNVPADALSGVDDPVVELGPRRLPLRRTYADVAPREALALVNAWNVVEVAVRNGNAATELGLAPGSGVRIRSSLA